MIDRVRREGRRWIDGDCICEALEETYCDKSAMSAITTRSTIETRGVVPSLKDALLHRSVSHTHIVPITPSYADCLQPVSSNE